jgi:hypothetical protein
VAALAGLAAGAVVAAALAPAAQADPVWIAHGGSTA